MVRPSDLVGVVLALSSLEYTSTRHESKEYVSSKGRGSARPVLGSMRKRHPNTQVLSIIKNPRHLILVITYFTPQEAVSDYFNAPNSRGPASFDSTADSQADVRMPDF